MTPRPLLPGGRVALRVTSAADATELARLARESRTLHHPFVRPPQSRTAFLRWLAKRDADRQRSFVVCLRESGAITGVVNVNEIVRGPFQSAYLGYYAHAAFAGRGLMHEGLGLVLSHAFGRLRLHRLEANVQPQNAASLALVRRLGFRREGMSPRYLRVDGAYRDHERWAVLAEDWTPAAGATRKGSA